MIVITAKPDGTLKIHICLKMVRSNKPLIAIHILLMIVMYCRPGELLQFEREDLIKPMHGGASDSPPPPRAAERAEQNAKLRRHHRLEQQILPLDHQSGSSPG